MRPNQPVDSKCKQKINEAHVYEEGSLIWGSMLNQTNVDKNNNKFYILQLLKDNKSNNFNVWFRWGRVGYPGQNSLTPFGGNLEGAKHCFTTKFHDKTGNDWADKDNFETLSKKYTLIHMDCSQETSPPPKSKLDRRIQGLLELICDFQAMEQTAKELEFDFELSPLGKLTKHQIAEGYRILGELEKQIRGKKFGEEFVDLVNEYYTKIPHNFGYRQKPPLINTVEMLKNETDLLQVLEGIEIAVKSIGEAKNTGEKLSTIDKCYKDLHCDVSPVEKGSSDHQMIEKYMKLTHGDTHKYSMKITNIYQIERHTETERFKKDIGNRMLLWHGSRTTNFYGILSKGLRIAPPEAPVSGYMFGKGIYFADMASKSGNYCFPAPGKPGLLLLCEVALGESNELYESDCDADKLPAGKHSTKGIGNTYPNEKGYFELEDGTVVPCGEPTQSTANSSLLYNEYIVYNVDQVRIRYLVEVEFGSSPSFQLD